MNKKFILKSLVILLFSVFALIILTNNVEASSTELSASATQINVGESATITASVTAGAWNLNLAGGGQTKGLVGQTNTTSNSSSSVSIGFTPTSAGDYKFTLTGDVTDYVTDVNEPVSKTINIKVIEKETPNNNETPSNNETPNNNNNNASNTNTPTNNTTVQKSSEARLSNVWFEPRKYDFKGFKKDTTSYDIQVPYEAEEITVNASVYKNAKAKVEGTGKVKLKEGEVNTITLKVTAEDGKTTKTYTFKVTRLAKQEIPEETPNTTEVPNNNEETPPTVTPDEPKKELGLETLIVKDLNMNPTFNSTTYEYTVGLKEDLSSLNIQATPNQENAAVEIIGNENLQQGENVITILVSNSETEEVATYQIIVNKNVAVQEVVGKVDWLKPSTWGLKEKLIVCIAIVLLVVIVVVVVIKVRLSRVDDDDFDLPGADELDRALAEHQELAVDQDDDFYPNEENNMNFDFEQNNIDSSQEEENPQDTNSNEPSLDYTEKLDDDETSYYTSKRKGKHF